MLRNKIIFVLLLVLFLGCKTKERIVEVPVDVVHTERIVNKDSIYFRDSVWTIIDRGKDTIVIKEYNLQIREKYLTDTVHKVDSIPVTIKVETVKEVNKLHSWQKGLMAVGGVGVLGLLITIIYFITKWKLRL